MMNGVPRGVRNNNPGNIRNIPNEKPWRGQEDANDVFCHFSTPQLGLRAMAVLLRHYHTIDGASTITAICERWSPPSENDTKAKLLAMCQFMQISPLAAAQVRIDMNSSIRLMECMRAIVFTECGSPPVTHPEYPDWYSVADYARAIEMAAG